MQIYYPRVADNYDDWTEGEYVFLNFMLHCMLKEGSMTAFNIHEDDMRRMLLVNAENCLYKSDNYERLSRVFNMAFLNEANVQIQLKKEVYNRINGGRNQKDGSSRMPIAAANIHTKAALCTHFYIMGRVASGDYIDQEESEVIRPYEDNLKVLGYKYKMFLNKSEKFPS